MSTLQNIADRPSLAIHVHALQEHESYLCEINEAMFAQGHPNGLTIQEFIAAFLVVAFQTGFKTYVPSRGESRTPVRWTVLCVEPPYSARKR